MATPVTVDIPHQLGKAAVRARLDGGIDKISASIPGGSVTDHRWEGDTLHFTVKAMGQTIASAVTVYETNVHAVVDLPGILGLFASKIQEYIGKEAPKLLR
ncbi:polyhydroxyalkanoic acid system family protein [Sphingomonas sp. PP-CC-3A-396]|uniref:polyhydroxyalkanoic acid system family protein n=1 Tax=Sphingomonas sp. PP-CC-3A-396 TaxID=2135655 RepID=UPI00104FFDA3|nr:polyhydroxyalkanoic acid system family protein [Sphingomonas sp. PP-CC-3A-396]TCQ10897.1 putative polyhydroxyalkanoic acid system protein [Sphingomonas sp. PP-CC-3A-396]